MLGPKVKPVRSESDPAFAGAAGALLRYEPDTGRIVWRCDWYCARKDAEAGNINAHGYRVVGLFGKDRYAHRLAWLLHTGALPRFTIDHINGNRSDNRIKNLRDVPTAINVQNVVNCRAGNRSGLLGVSYRAELGKWQAAIVASGRRIHLGIHSSKEEAHAAYLAAKALFHAEAMR